MTAVEVDGPTRTLTAREFAECIVDTRNAMAAWQQQYAAKIWKA
jgi:hypothetical protein